MRKHLHRLPVILMLGWSLSSCHEAVHQTAKPAPESEQAIRETMKELYMKASAAAPQSPEQQKVVLRMSEKAFNGKELLLVMRAAAGVFPAGSESGEKLHSTVTAKMMALGTLEQLIEYTAQYTVEPEQARAYVHRMFQLGEETSDARSWYRIRAAAYRLKLSDLTTQAQVRADQLAGR